VVPSVQVSAISMFAQSLALWSLEDILTTEVLLEQGYFVGEGVSTEQR
jgi:hypothetical protein